MALNPRDMDAFMAVLSTTDIKKKMTVGNLLLNYLADPDKSIECQDIGMFIDQIIPWLNNGNPRVVQNGLDILTYLADRMGHDFKPYISTIIQATIDRLGDSKDTTREKARLVLLKVMETGSMMPQQLLDRLHPAFSHKNAKLREEALVLLTTTLNEHGHEQMLLSGVISSIVKLLSDPNEKVRETAVNTAVTIYSHIGDRFRLDLQKKHNVPPAKWALLVERFDQAKEDGKLLPLALSADVGKDVDETDRAIKSAPVKRATSVLQKRSQFGPAKSIPTAPGQAGAVDEESFLTAFEDVPSVKLFSAKDLEDQMKQIRETIGDDKKDWKQRTESLKKIRGIIIAGGMGYENFMELLKSIQRPFESACTDLRSQVVREACITLAFLSQHLKNKFASFVEAVLLSLMNLIQNSAKVVASAGAVALRFIFQNTHSGRFIPIIAETLGNKSKDIRRASCEYLNLILQTWPTSILQKHVTVLQGAIKKGVADSDSEARVFARKSYWAFKDHFPEQAEVLLNSLDSTYKRSLITLSNSGSMNSLNAVARSSNISPRASRPGITGAGRVTPGPRSTSAIDLHAAKRAQARAIYANITRARATPPKLTRSPETSSAASTERSPRTRTRVAGVSQSQPSSRSGSPSSRLSYATYNRDGESLVPRPRRLSGQGIRSTGNSREPSPQRFGMNSTSKIRSRNMYMTQNDRPPPSRPVLAHKMLLQSLEAESALADALTFETIDCYPRSARGKGDHSDDSETSSMCSERSMDGVRRHSDDIKEIIENCGRKSWGDRKEGLVCLQNFLANGNTLTATELRKVTDIFAKMFMDSHTKVFSLFLDTLNELITTHNEDLGDWLYVLCARLLNKLGTDLLGSVQTKIHKTLEVVREYFPGDLLLPAVMRFLTDPGQTPNSRVKVSTLVFLTHVAESSAPSALNSTCKTALARLLDWTNDVKSQDVRRHAQEAVVALYNLNPPQFPMLLSELPQFYQDTAMPLVQNHLRRSSGSNPASPGTQPGRSPHSPARTRTKADIDMTDADNLNPEEVYKSLRRTTAEIQNYGFERATTSKDSGINNMADVEEKLESLTLTSSGRSSSVSSPTQRGRTGMNMGVNGSSDSIAGDLPKENNGYDTHSSSPDMPRGPEFLDNTIQTLQLSTTQNAAKVQALQDFQLYVGKGDAAYIQQHFKKLLKALLECLASDDKELEIQVLQTLIEMLKRPDLVESFSKYAELLVLKVLEAHKGSDEPQKSAGMDATGSGSSPAGLRTSKQMQGLKAAEKCAAMIATVLPADQVIRLASSTITTEPYPKNMGAIKMLHVAVEHRGREAIEPHLSKIMPGLITAYDDAESKVRKTAVFCMVAIYNAVGKEVIEPHLESLYGSKRKLLNIYIQRARQVASQPASPRTGN